MYNANPNYEMNFAILKDVNEHMEGLFQRFSKLLPFRIDFAYKKGTPSFGYSCKHSKIGRASCRERVSSPV